MNQNQNQETSMAPIKSSSSRFLVEYENQFVLLDDAKHVIGVDASDGSKIILENIENGKADKFEWRDSCLNYFTTLVYDENTGFLYSGYDDGQLILYKLDKTSKTCKKVNDYGKLGIGSIYSFHKFMHFVFFGGTKSSIKVLDLSTGELLPGHLETSIRWIYSLQVCVKSNNQIYLTVSGDYSDYSRDMTDLFDLTDLFEVDSVFLQKYI